MTQDPGPVDPTPDDGAGAADALASAREALAAARETVAALVTVRAKAIQEAARLRARAAVPGHEALEEPAALHTARATAIEERIEQMRDLARRAEVAYEALLADHEDAEALGDDDLPGSDGGSGTA